MASRADMDGGYVYIFRRVLDDPTFRTHAEALAFVWMIMRASYAPVCVRYKGHVVELQRGQLAVSIRDLAEHLEWSKDRVSRFLNTLRNRDMIETATATGVLVISVMKYDTYQRVSEDTATPREPEPRQHRDSTATQNKESKESKEGIRRESPSGDSPEFEIEAIEAVVAIAKHCARLCKKKPTDSVGAMGLWNTYAKRNGWPTALKLTAERRDKLRTRLLELGGIREWEGVLSRAECAAGLTTHPPPTWWDFDFIIRSETNVQKVLEGKYDRPFSNGASAGGQRDERESGNGMVRAVLAEQSSRARERRR